MVIPKGGSTQSNQSEPVGLGEDYRQSNTSLCGAQFWSSSCPESPLLRVAKSSSRAIPPLKRQKCSHCRDELEKLRNEALDLALALVMHGHQESSSSMEELSLIKRKCAGMQNLLRQDRTLSSCEKQQ